MEEDLKQNTVTVVGNSDIVLMNKKIKDCSDSSLSEFIISRFVTLFLDLQEVKNFIRYLYDKNGEVLIKDLLNTFDSTLKKFRKEFKSN